MGSATLHLSPERVYVKFVTVYLQEPSIPIQGSFNPFAATH
jgi:hypothetical protein